MVQASYPNNYIFKKNDLVHFLQPNRLWCDITKIKAFSFLQTNYYET